MANERGKELDKTHLSIDQAEERGFIHRDYIAHCLRWSHVAKYLQQTKRYETAHILDIGCGKEVPLAKLLYSSRLIPKSGSYLGIDANSRINGDAFNFGKFPINLLSGIFPRSLDEIVGGLGLKYDVITCFEVAEHVEPVMTLEILKGIKRYLSHTGVAFISTPCYDAGMGAAANHVNEMSHDAFGSLIEHAGLSIDNVWGTFASIKDYKDEIKACGYQQIFDGLREYYDSNYLATVFAPLFPKQSRNCLWRVSLTKAVQCYPKLSALTNPVNSSSEKWTSFVASEAK